METIKIQQDRYYLEQMVITHRFKELDNLVVSGGKLYQMQHFWNKRTLPLREVKPFLNGSIKYKYHNKPYTRKRLKELIYSHKQNITINTLKITPF